MTDAKTAATLAAAAGTTVCANCHSPTRDLFCGHCGQRAEGHLLSLRELLAEALEVITHADSRFWRTLRPLLLKPGLLTCEFLSGRRASYLAPFRLYLVLSVLFFLIASLTSGGHGAIHDPRTAGAAIAEAAAEINKEIDVADNPAEQAALDLQLRRLGQIRSQLSPRLSADARGPGGESTPCADLFKGSHSSWYAPRLVVACEKTKADSGRELSTAIVHNIGRAMFIFLPILAAVMQLLYWRPRRYYIEHLLLLLHNHAFVLLILSAFLAVAYLIPSDGPTVTLLCAVSAYMIYYLYQSMRTVYRQSHGVTLIKFTALAGTYCIFALVTVSLATLYSAATL